MILALSIGGGIVAYAALVLFMARANSDKWHPDGGRND